MQRPSLEINYDVLDKLFDAVSLTLFLASIKPRSIHKLSFTQNPKLKRYELLVDRIGLLFLFESLMCIHIFVG